MKTVTVMMQSWEAFTFKGKKWIAFHLDTSVRVFDADMNNYGAYYDVDSFKKHYAQDGEKLNLTA